MLHAGCTRMPACVQTHDAKNNLHSCAYRQYPVQGPPFFCTHSVCCHTLLSAGSLELQNPPVLRRPGWSLSTHHLSTTAGSQTSNGHAAREPGLLVQQRFHCCGVLRHIRAQERQIVGACSLVEICLAWQIATTPSIFLLIHSETTTAPSAIPSQARTCHSVTREWS